MAVLHEQSLNGHREMLTIKNPVTEEELGSIPVLTADDIRAAVERARAAQPMWQALGARQRGRLINRWKDMIWQDQKNCMAVIRRETGKTDANAFIEICILDAAVNYNVSRAPGLLRDQYRPSFIPVMHRAKVTYKPHGVVGFITPWNYPFMNALSDLVAALAMGNTAILKPSEVTPYTAFYAVEMMYKAGIPKDVVQVVTGDGRTGAALVDFVDYIMFTGSTANGKKVALRAAERLIPCSLELGGKDPVIILNDANLDAAATGTLRGALENAGQACVCVERVYVESGIYDAFVQKIVEYANKLVIGNGDGFDIHMGSLTNKRELLRCEEHVREAVASGAKVLYGGSARPDLGPHFFEPTVMIDVDHSMKLMNEETFGPIIPIMKVKDAEEAIQLANESEYGLSATIFTSDLRRGERLARLINAGDVSINRPQIVFGTPSVPMGGEKNSGVGRRNGKEGLLRFVKTQSIITDTLLIAPTDLTQADPISLLGMQVMRLIHKVFPYL